MPLPAAKALAITEAERRELPSLGEHRSTPRGVVLRIRIILDASTGLANREIARRNSTSVPPVLLWRRRWEGEGMAGILVDRPRKGRPKDITAEHEEKIVE